MHMSTGSRIADCLEVTGISLPNATHGEYDRARAVLNGRVNRKPAFITYPENAVHVGELIRLVPAEGLGLSVRGAGHDIHGESVCVDGIVVDLGSRRLSLYETSRTAIAQPGLTLDEFIRAIHKRGFIVPFGSQGTVGLAGFTIGSGTGLLMSRYKPFFP